MQRSVLLRWWTGVMKSPTSSSATWRSTKLREATWSNSLIVSQIKRSTLTRGTQQTLRKIAPRKTYIPRLCKITAKMETPENQPFQITGNRHGGKLTLVCKLAAATKTKLSLAACVDYQSAFMWVRRMNWPSKHMNMCPRSKLSVEDDEGQWGCATPPNAIHTLIDL